MVVLKFSWVKEWVLRDNEKHTCVNIDKKEGN